MKKTSLLAAFAVAGALTSQAALYTFGAMLSGTQEVPANASTGGSSLLPVVGI